MTRNFLRAATLGIAVLLPAAVSVSVADAQSAGSKDAAIAAYTKGTTHYNLGNWDKAITHFKKAFELYPDAAFLFNIA